MTCHSQILRVNGKVLYYIMGEIKEDYHVVESPGFTTITTSSDLKDPKQSVQAVELTPSKSFKDQYEEHRKKLAELCKGYPLYDENAPEEGHRWINRDLHVVVKNLKDFNDQKNCYFVKSINSQDCAKLIHTAVFDSYKESVYLMDSKKPEEPAIPYKILITGRMEDYNGGKRIQFLAKFTKYNQKSQNWDAYEL